MAKQTKKQNTKESSQKVQYPKGLGVKNYPVGDFLVRLKNACLARQKSIDVPSTKFIKEVAKALKLEGYIQEISEDQGLLNVQLEFRKKEPLLSDVKLVSKPGLRIYIQAKELEKRRAPSILLISTPFGVMSSKAALKKHVGGEVIAEIL